MLFIGLLFDCLYVFKALFKARSVIAMLTENGFKNVGGGVTMDFAPYFHQNGFDSRFSSLNIKSWSKTTELVCKRN